MSYDRVYTNQIRSLEFRMANTRNLKCRYCGWTTPVWRARKGKKPVSGMARLIDHVWDEHPDEYVETQRLLLREGKIEEEGDDDMRHIISLHDEVKLLKQEQET